MKKLIFIALAFGISLVACNVDSNTANSETLVDSVELRTGTVAEYIETEINDSVAYLIADTITYSVVVKANAEEDAWTAECMRRLDKQTLVDALFKALYDGRLKAYDYYSNEEYSIDKIKELDKANSRDNIGKIQFDEEWYFDNETLKMSKIVASIMLGYERYAETGEPSGYTAGMKIVLNK